MERMSTPGAGFFFERTNVPMHCGPIVVSEGAHGP